MVLEAKKCGGGKIFSRIIEHDESTIRNLTGYDTIAELLEHPHRGWGYWAWKPLIVLDALRGLAEDEALVYLDSGLALKCGKDKELEYGWTLQRIAPWTAFDVTAMPNGQRSGARYAEWKWTKADTLEHFGVLNNTALLNSPQFVATYFFLRATPASLDLVQRWLDTYRIPQLVNDAPSHRRPDPSGFRENRHDQSVWSVLRKLHPGTANVHSIPMKSISKQRHPKGVPE